MSSTPFDEKPPAARDALVARRQGRDGVRLTHATRVRPLSSRGMTVLWAGTLFVLAWAVISALSANYGSMMVSGGLTIVLVSIILTGAAPGVQRDAAAHLKTGDPIPVVTQPAAHASWASTAPIRSGRRRVQ